MASNGKRWLVRLGLVGAAFIGGAVAARASDATNEREVPYAPLSQLARVLVQVENRYVDPVDRQRLLEGAIKGMVAELDPHSAFLPPREFAQFSEDTGGAFGGIGVEVDFRQQRVLVLAPIPDSPAARAGIRSGDELLAVDGKPLAGMPAEAIVRAMRGVPGSRVSLTLKKKDATEPTTLELIRAEVHVRSVEGKRLSGNVGYLRLRQFQADTHREWLATLATLRHPDKPPLVGVVLDLRNNPGGLVDQAEAIADELLDAGLIYSMRHRGKVVEEAIARRGGTLTDLPVVALVNEYSASSSELLVGALKDAGRATVVGAPTFGKGSVQTIYELPGKSGLRLTTMRYYTPRGHPIQARGVQPDVLVRYEEDLKSPLPVMREGDLDGALEQEAGAPDGPPPAEVVTGKKRPELLTLDDVPSDPTGSDDVALLAALRCLASARVAR